MTDLSNAERKRLAGYLHTANALMYAGKADVRAGNPAHGKLYDASELIKLVIETLMGVPGMTDFYGNLVEGNHNRKTERTDNARRNLPAVGTCCRP
jgi:hypothetical protein